MAKYAMSTVGQGASAFIALSHQWTVSGATEATGGWFARLKFSVPSVAVNNHLLGSSSSTGGSLRTLADGALRFRNNSADLITSAPGAIVPGHIHETILRRVYLPVSGIQLELDGQVVGFTTTLTISWLGSVNQVARFSTSAASELTVYELELFNGAASYSALWDFTTAQSTGTSWMSTAGTRTLTINNATGATDSWWPLYGAVYVGEGIFSLNAKADVALASAKVGTALMSAVAAAALAVRGSKIGTTQMDMPIAAGITLSASKTGAATVSMPISAALGFADCKVGAGTIDMATQVALNLYASNIYIGEGTFSMSVAADVSLKGAKVGQSNIPFVAAASVHLQASKVGKSAAPVNASAKLSAAGYKVGLGTIAVLATATINLSGGNQDPEIDPVTVVFVRTSSRRVYNLRTSSRYTYTIKTSSGGARV